MSGGGGETTNGAGDKPEEIGITTTVKKELKCVIRFT